MDHTLFRRSLLVFLSFFVDFAAPLTATMASQMKQKLAIVVNYELVRLQFLR